MTTNKMRWTRPQLIVLSRGSPEESVLEGCKAIGFAGSAADAMNSQKTGCDYPPDVHGICGACQSRGDKS